MTNSWKLFCLSLLLLAGAGSRVTAGDTLRAEQDPILRKQFHIGGYLKEMPSVGYDNLSEEFTFNNILHNRINMRYRPSESLQFSLEFRNRILSGEMVRQHGEILAELMKHDPGLVDASYVPVSNERMLWHFNADRFYADWHRDKWQVRLGRQRINWGINMVSNPNDLFNNFSFFDFDYEERPGSDALRVQYFPGDMSRVELALSPAETTKESVAAMLWGFNRSGYDFQIITGYFRNRTALGAGWAGNIKGSGFKGEVTLFNSIEKMDSMTVVASVGFDHMFGNGMYGFAELLYNGGYTSPANLLFLNEPMRADNIFISKYAVTASLMYPISPVLAASFSAMVMPDIEAFYLMPNLQWSVVRNLDAGFVVQLFRFAENAGVTSINGYLQIKWSF